MLKALIAGLLLSFSPYYLSTVPTGDTEASDVKVVTVKVTADTDGDEPTYVIATSGDGEGLANAYVYGGPEVILSEGPQVIALAAAGDKTGGWLGVQVGEVPEALAAQLEIGDAGVIVTNVVEGGPAEGAGIQRHDVIIAIDGEKVTGSVQDVAKSISLHEPGEQIKIKVLRAAGENVIPVKLGSRADMSKMTWKFEHFPLEETEEHFNVRGRIMGKGPDGEWFIKDLRDLEDLEDLPKSVVEVMPHPGCWSTIRLDGDAKSVKVKVQRESEVLVIEREDEGDIVVRRTDADGNETATTYESEEALEAGDPEAYETFQEINVGTGLSIELEGLEGLKALKSLDFLKDVEFDLDELKGDVDVWRVDLENSLQEAHRAYEDAMKQLEHAFKAHLPAGHDITVPRGISEEEETTVDVFVAKPKHSFDVDVDGVIIVRVREGDSELVRRFKNGDDLAERNPELYEKYEALMGADKE
jgi:hypothetical protein